MDFVITSLTSHFRDYDIYVYRVRASGKGMKPLADFPLELDTRDRSGWWLPRQPISYLDTMTGVDNSLDSVTGELTDNTLTLECRTYTGPASPGPTNKMYLDLNTLLWKRTNSKGESVPPSLDWKGKPMPIPTDHTEEKP